MKSHSSASSRSSSRQASPTLKTPPVRFVKKPIPTETTTPKMPPKIKIEKVVKPAIERSPVQPLQAQFQAPSPIHFPLANFGTDCFANSVVQCFRFIEKIRSRANELAAINPNVDVPDLNHRQEIAKELGRIKNLIVYNFLIFRKYIAWKKKFMHNFEKYEIVKGYAFACWATGCDRIYAVVLPTWVLFTSAIRIFNNNKNALLLLS